MTLFSIIAFVGVMLFFALAPGQRLFATVSRSKANGFSHASLLVLGIVMADLVFIFLTIFAYETLADFIKEQFIFINYLAGIYLSYLAYKMLLSKDHERMIIPVKEMSFQKNFLSGLIISFSDFKSFLFYLALLPSFLDFTLITNIHIIIICVCASFVLAAVLLFYAYKTSGVKKQSLSSINSKIVKRENKIKVKQEQENQKSNLVIRA